MPETKPAAARPRLIKPCTRNGYIDLWRFLASCGICLYHGERLFITDMENTNTIQYSGFIYVDFFFLLSGYFAMSYIARHAGEAARDCGLSTGRYIWNKYKRIYPYVFVCVPLTWYVTIRIAGNYTQADKLKTALYMPFEMLLLDRSGAFAEHPEATPQLWYLSAMLLTLPLLVYVGLRWQGLLRGVLCWLGPVVLYGWLIQNTGSILASGVNEKVTYRAMAGMLAGCFVYVLSQAMSRWRATILLRALLLAVELAAAVFIWRVGDTWADLGEYTYVVLLAFFVMLTICFSGLTPTGHIHSHILSFLGRLSLPMYVSHFIFRIIMFNTNLLYEYTYEGRVGRYMGWTIGFSLALLLVLDYILPFIWKYAKRLFVRPEPAVPAAPAAPAATEAAAPAAEQTAAPQS